MLFHNILAYLHSLSPYIESLGIFAYVLVFLVAFVESTLLLGIFIPGSLILAFFGYTASEGGIHLLPAITAAFLGAFVGDLVGYFLGKYGGDFMHRHKRWLKADHIDIGKRFFYQHGGKSIFFGRFIGPIRSILSVVAGMSRMSLLKFNIFNACGAILWVCIYILIGYFFAEQGKDLDTYVSKASLDIAIFLVVCAVVLIFVYVRKKQEGEGFVVF